MLTSLISFSFHASAVIIPMLLRNVYAKLLKRIEKAEQLIYASNITQTPVTKTGRFYFFTIVPFLLTCYSWYITFGVYKWLPPTAAIGHVTNHSRFVVFIVHLLLLLFVVESKLASINWHLDYLTNRVPVYLAFPDDEIFIESKIHAKGVPEKFVKYTDDVRLVTAHKIRTFNQIHFLLYSTSNLIAKYFSLQLLFCILTTAFHAFKLFIKIFDSAENIYQRATIIVFIIFNTMLVFYVANICHKIKSQVK